jgi:hydrogenase expression/formation protein HypD
VNFRTEFQDKNACSALAAKIREESKRPVVIMEVCGGHTMAIHRFGIHSLLPPTVKLISGPGCPVCVSDIRYIDHAIALARCQDIIITTYGDLIRVPGSSSSLEKEKASGADIRVVWSALESLTIAETNSSKKVVFLGIGFETTAPGTAIAVIEAQKRGNKNFYVLSSHKIMPPAMTMLIDEGVKIDAYLCPGHVSVITGAKMYEPIAMKYHKACVISGFEPADILQAIWMIVRQVENNRTSVEIQYSRAVHRDGNRKAQEMLRRVFELKDERWRGLGLIPMSGMKLSEEFRAFDASGLKVDIEEPHEAKGCICGEVLKGLKSPVECALFKKVCSPDHPVGACMVSSEGSCAAAYQYS